MSACSDVDSASVGQGRVQGAAVLHFQVMLMPLLGVVQNRILNSKDLEEHSAFSFFIPVAFTEIYFVTI